MKKELAVMKEKVKEGYATMKMEHEWVKAEMKKLKKLVGDGEINENENDNDDENDTENNENNNNNNDNDDDNDKEAKILAMWKACEGKELKMKCKLTQKGKEWPGMCRLHLFSGKKAKYCIPCGVHYPCEKGDNYDKEVTELMKRRFKACEGKQAKDSCEMYMTEKERYIFHGKTWKGMCLSYNKKDLYCNTRVGSGKR